MSTVDERCQRCGHANAVWWTQDDIWNAVVRTDGADEWGILCPTCFAELAESRVLGERVRWAFVPEVLASPQMVVHGEGVRDEQHDVPEGEQHQLDAYCWCRPEVVRIERDPDGTLRDVQVVHRGSEPAADPVSDRLPVMGAS